MMTANEFKSLQAEMGLNNDQAAQLLGCSLSTVVKYRGGSQPVPKDTAIVMRLLVLSQNAVNHLREQGKDKEAAHLHYQIQLAIL